MTALVVVRNAGGFVVAFGPADGAYQPCLPNGCTSSVETDPTLNFEPPPDPAPIEQIRAIERTPEVADAMQRGSRLVALAYALDDLIRVAASKGQTVTRTQAHAWAMANDTNYKTLYDAEQTIKPLRALV